MESTLLQNLLAELRDGPPLPEFAAALESLAASMDESQSSLEQSSAVGRGLTSDLETTRQDLGDFVERESETSSAVRQMQEEVARMGSDMAQLQLAAASIESALRSSGARVAELRSQCEVGAGWSSDQLQVQRDLAERQHALQLELSNRQQELVSARQENGILSAQREAAARAAAEAEKGVSAVREELSRARGRVTAVLHAKELAEEQLADGRELCSGLRATLAERTAQAETGAMEVDSIQSALQHDKAGLEECIQSCDRLKLRSTKVGADLELTALANASLSEVLHQFSERSEQLATEAADRRKEAAKLVSLVSLTSRKIGEAEAQVAAACAQRDELRSSLDSLTSTQATLRATNAAKQAAAEAARREVDSLSAGINKVSGLARSYADAALATRGMQRAVIAEAEGYATAVRRLRAELAGVQRELDRYATSCDEASQAYFTAVEAVKLQELQISALTCKANDATVRVKTQQGLFDALKADRNRFAKQLAEAQVEMGGLQDTFRSRVLAIEKLKEDITAKDTALLKEHFEHHKMEKEKEGLRNDCTRLQKQIMGCSQLLAQQEDEISKLSAIVTEAEVERVAQEREADAITAERALLHAQLVKRERELAAMYERLRAHRCNLTNGAASYAQAVNERDALAVHVASLKGALQLATSTTEDGAKLAVEARALDEEIANSRAKVAALDAEASRPINVHRWHALSERDPEKWALILRTHSLQRRLLETHAAAQSKAAAKTAAESELAALRKLLLSVQSRRMCRGHRTQEDVDRNIVGLQLSCKSKSNQLSTLEAELEAARAAVGALRDEGALLQSCMASLHDAYMQQFRILRKEQRDTTKLRRQSQVRPSASGAGADGLDALTLQAGGGGEGEEASTAAEEGKLRTSGTTTSLAAVAGDGGGSSASKQEESGGLQKQQRRRSMRRSLAPGSQVAAAVGSHQWSAADGNGVGLGDSMADQPRQLQRNRRASRNGTLGGSGTLTSTRPGDSRQLLSGAAAASAVKEEADRLLAQFVTL